MTTLRIDGTRITVHLTTEATPGFLAEQVQAELMRAVLAEVGSKRRAAEVLGVSTRTLQRFCRRRVSA